MLTTTLKPPGSWTVAVNWYALAGAPLGTTLSDVPPLAIVTQLGWPVSDEIVSGSTSGSHIVNQDRTLLPCDSSRPGTAGRPDPGSRRS